MLSFLTRRSVILFLSGIVWLGLYACNASVPESTLVSELVSTATLPPTATAAPLPTVTPLPPLVVLLAPPEVDPALTDALQPLVTELTEQAGMRFQVRPALSQADLGADVQLVVVLPPDPGVADLVSAAPETQFLVIGIPDLEPAANLSLIGAQGERPDQLGFLAGYIAAAITPDWRVAIVSEDTATGEAARLGFINGVTFFCGLCRPAYPPFPIPGYPLYVELPLESGEADWQAAATYFRTWFVQTAFVYPEANPALLAILAQSDVNLIGVGTPPDGLQEQWVASIGEDAPVQAVESLLPGLLAREGAANVDLPLVITAANPELFSPGRQRLVAKMLADLLAGYIGTGVDP